MGDATRIREAGRQDVDRLEAFFQVIGRDEALTAFFHPHPFTREQAEWVCARPPEARDVYLVAVEGPGEDVAGYAMLRGWDEGYEVPAFGVCVRPDRQGMGLGAALLAHAVGIARERGSARVMLKVHRDNAVARALYERHGFVFGADDGGEQRVGYRELA